MPLNAMPGHLIRRLHQLSTATFSEQMKAAGIDMTSVQFAALHKAAPVVSALQSDILSGLSGAERAQFIALASKAVGLEDGFDALR